MSAPAAREDSPCHVSHKIVKRLVKCLSEAKVVKEINEFIIPIIDEALYGCQYLIPWIPTTLENVCPTVITTAIQEDPNNF